MPITYNESRKLFLIETENSHYSFYVMNGHLRSAYYGKKLRNPEDIAPPDSFQMIDGGETTPKQYYSEYTGWGNMFYHEPTLKVTFADGTRDLDLEYSGYEIPDENTLFITLKDTHFDFSVKLIYKIYGGIDIIDRNCVIINNTGENVTINSAASAVVNFPYTETPYRLTSMGSIWAHEYDIVRTPITKSATVLQSRAGVSNATNLPYFAVDRGSASENEGEVWFGALKWSGNFKIVAELDTKFCPRITAGINDFDFSYILKDGEDFTTPILTLGHTVEGFSGASRQIHEYTRRYQYGGYWADKCLPIIYNSWTSFECKIDEQKLMELADNAAKLGIELFVVDDGWFSTRDDDLHGLGDWYPNKRRFPNGLDPLIKHVNDLGMMFGIWVEPEMVNPDTELYKKHPDWVMNFPSRERELKRNQLTLNLAREDVYEYIIGFLDDLLSNHNIGYLKWDMNRWFAQPGWPELPKEEQQSMWYGYVRNFHRIFEHLNEKFPKVIIENCASGGLRSDLAMSQWCSRINRSDNQDPVDELYLHEGFTYLHLSRSAGGAGHISANRTGINQRECEMKYKAHVGLMGSLGIGMDLRKMSDEEIEELKSYIALDKEIRHIVQLGDLYRIHSIRECDNAVFEFVSKDKREALVFVFGPSRKFRMPYENIKLFGLDPDTVYDVNGEYDCSGDGLMQIGLRSGLHTLGTMQSKLFRITAK